MDRIWQAALDYDGPRLSGGARGAEIGGTDNAIKVAAAKIGLDVNVRTARLALASEAFGRKIETFKQLTDGELKAVAGWASSNVDTLATWLAVTYGGTLEMDL